MPQTVHVCVTWSDERDARVIDAHVQRDAHNTVSGFDSKGGPFKFKKVL